MGALGGHQEDRTSYVGLSMGHRTVGEENASVNTHDKDAVVSWESTHVSKRQACGDQRT